MKGNVVLVTGSGRGIGAATAKLFAQNGARVCLTSRSKRELETVQGEIQQAGGEAIVIPADLSDEKQIEPLFREIDGRYGRLDILVNNAGHFISAPLEAMTLAQWDAVFAINVRAMFLCSQQALLRMKTTGGAIINVSSLAGIRAVEKYPGFGAYTASKHAVIGLTEALAVEGRPNNIRVNAIAPGAVDTEMLRKAVPGLKPKTVPADIAHSIYFLADPSQSKCISGSILEIYSNS